LGRQVADPAGMDKSFLLLFCKKEGLFFSPKTTQKPPPFD
jgi:hypothetical protein